MKNINELHEEWMQNPEYRKEYESLEEEFSIAHALISARSKAKLTQSEVAKRMKTTQSVVARLESGAGNPSIETLKKYAMATGSQLKIDLMAAT